MERIKKIINSSDSIFIKTKKLQEIAKEFGFDWDSKEASWKKVEEELDELKIEVANDDYEKQKDEFGDVLFALINYSRFLRIDIEESLKIANHKFIKRFKKTLELINNDKKNMNQLSQTELTKYWKIAKSQI